MSYYNNTDFYLEVEKGNIPGHSILTALGERETIGITATGEDLWRGNQLTPAPTSHTFMPTPAAAGEQMTVISESNADNGATATGILSVRLHYIDANGIGQIEDKTLNGTTGVDTSATDIRFINDIHALTVGSNNAAEGHIKIYKKGSVGLVYNMIALGGNRSVVPHRMVPTGKKLYLEGWHATEARGRRCTFRIRSTDMYGVLLPGVFCFKGVAYLEQSPSGHLPLNVQMPALSIVKVSGWADQSGAEGSCGWWGVLVDDLIAW